MKKRNKSVALFLFFLIVCGIFAGCKKETKVVLTTGFRENEVFRISGVSCMLPEAMIYLTNLQNQYESVYGSRIWERKNGDRTLEEEVKEQVLGELAQVKSMALLARQKGVLLEEDEEERVVAAAAEYYASLNETEKELFGFDESDIAGMYRECALADKVYQQIVSTVDPEISDDEARTITVWAIRLDDRDSAQSVLQEATAEGADFEALAKANSQDSVISYSFGKGETDAAIEQAAFELGKDEISPVIEAQDGYYILKCISTFDQERTQENKKRLADRIRSETFEKEYDSFTDGLTRQLNTKLWESVRMVHDDRVTTNLFFRIYDRYFKTE